MPSGIDDRQGSSIDAYIGTGSRRSYDAKLEADAKRKATIYTTAIEGINAGAALIAYSLGLVSNAFAILGLGTLVGIGYYIYRRWRIKSRHY